MAVVIGEGNCALFFASLAFFPLFFSIGFIVLSLLVSTTLYQENGEKEKGKKVRS